MGVAFRGFGRLLAQPQQGLVLAEQFGQADLAADLPGNEIGEKKLNV